jgi:hypothetical protein
MVRARTVRGALRAGGPDAALDYLAEDLASKLDSCEDHDARLTLTRALCVVLRDISVNRRATARNVRDTARTAKPTSNLVALVKNLREAS